MKVSEMYIFKKYIRIIQEFNENQIDMTHIRIQKEFFETRMSHFEITVVCISVEKCIQFFSIAWKTFKALQHQ